MALPDYEIRPSGRRTRTMTAFREECRIVVVVPAHLSLRQRHELIPPLLERFLAKEVAQRPPRADHELTERARRLFDEHLTPAVGEPAPSIGVRWVSNQKQRWGSCTPETGEIRVSDRLRTVPSFVLDYVLLHELAHLVERDHTARFWQLVGGHGEAARARGFLEGLDFARAVGPA